MRQYLWMAVILLSALVLGSTTPVQAAPKKAKKRWVAVKKKLPPPPQPVVPENGLLTRVGSKGLNVTVDMKAGGLYLVPCILGTERRILPTWVPQSMSRKSYQLSCVSSVDRVSRLSFSVRCSGRALENESAAYPLDREFIVRLSCH